MAHLFVDGTAFFGNEATLDNVRCCCYWSPGGEIQWESDWSLNGVCQSSFHGELLAVHRALQVRWKVTVYCDCPVVVDCTFDLLSNHDNGTLSNCKCDTEIWHLILQQISLRPKGHVSIGKVQARQNWHKLPMGLERWCAYYNSWADFHAKEFMCIDQKRHFDWVLKMEKAKTKLKQTHEVFVNYVCNVAKCFESSFSKTARTNCEGRTSFNLHDPLSTARKVGIPKPLDIESNIFFAFPWGPQLLWRLVQWSQKLVWCPHGQCQCLADSTATELFADFAVTMGSRMPVCLTTRKERKLDVHKKPFSQWELQGLNVQADMLGALRLSVHTTTFMRIFKFLQKHGNLLQWPKQLNHRARPSALTGLSTKQFGYRCRPRLVIKLRWSCMNIFVGMVLQGGTRRLLFRFPLNLSLSHPSLMYRLMCVRPESIRLCGCLSSSTTTDVRETYVRPGVHEFFTITEQWVLEDFW